MDVMRFNFVLQVCYAILCASYILYIYSQIRLSLKYIGPYSHSAYGNLLKHDPNINTSALQLVLSPPKEQTLAYQMTLLHARRERLEKFCRRDEFKGPRSAQDFIVDLKRNLAYCEVSKIGSTFWKSVFAILKGNITNVRSPAKLILERSGQIHKMKFQRFSGLSYSERKSMLEHGRFLLFVRDPYMRLLSAYMDKFVRPNLYYWSSYGALIVQYIRRSLNPDERYCGHDITFEEFIRFFIISQNGRTFSNRDRHWTPIHKLCSPCDYPYVYIGKTESMFGDTRAILHGVNLSGVISFDAERATSVSEDIFRRATQFVDEYSILNNCTDGVDIVERFWRYLMAKGYFKPNTPVPKVLENVSISDPYLKRKLSDTAISQYHVQKFPGSCEKYQTQFATEIFSQVPKDKLKALKNILKHDCILFGYDSEPAYVFSSKPVSEEP